MHKHEGEIELNAMDKSMTEGIIPVSSARRLSKESGSPCIVIFAIEPDGGKFTITTYGQTKPLCKHAASLGSQFAEAIFNETVAPLSSEPDDLPDSPAQFQSNGELNDT